MGQRGQTQDFPAGLDDSHVTQNQQLKAVLSVWHAERFVLAVMNGATLKPLTNTTN